MSYSRTNDKYIPNNYLEAMKLLFQNDEKILEKIVTQYNRTRLPRYNNFKLNGDLKNNSNENKRKIDKILEKLNLKC